MENLDLPKPQTDLPLPEKEIPAITGSKFSILKSKFFIGFVIISTLIAFLVGGFVLRKNQTNDKNTTPPVTISKSPTQTPNPTTKWNTYKDIGFNFKYPNNWTLELPQPWDKHTYLRSVDGDNFITVYNAINNNSSNSDFIFYDLFSGNLQKSELDKYKINLYKMNNYDVYEIDNVPLVNFKCTYKYITKDNKNFTILAFCTTNSKDDNNFEQVLSSFRLTSTQNQTVCTQEAKLCPDGSYVGRSGPKCEFTPCPAQ